VNHYHVSPSPPLARQIYDEFVSTSAPNQVNLDESVREQIDAAFASEDPSLLTANVFDEAQYFVMHILQYDSFKRFQKSDVFPRK